MVDPAASDPNRTETTRCAKSCREIEGSRLTRFRVRREYRDQRERETGRCKPLAHAEHRDPPDDRSKPRSSDFQFGARLESRELALSTTNRPELAIVRAQGA